MLNMKKIPLLSVLALMVLGALLAGCGDDSPESQARKKGQEIWFEEVLHEYGDIPEKSDGTCMFTFKNLGKEAIVVNRVRSTCGCTVPEWPHEPVEPGETGEIKVVYNTVIKGPFYKSIYVYSSAANSPVKLQIKGKVLPVTP
jgi:hypothetical protein